MRLRSMARLGALLPAVGGALLLMSSTAGAQVLPTITLSNPTPFVGETVVVSIDCGSQAVNAVGEITDGDATPATVTLDGPAQVFTYDLTFNEAQDVTIQATCNFLEGGNQVDTLVVTVQPAPTTTTTTTPTTTTTTTTTTTATTTSATAPSTTAPSTTAPPSTTAAPSTTAFSPPTTSPPAAPVPTSAAGGCRWSARHRPGEGRLVAHRVRTRRPGWGPRLPRPASALARTSSHALVDLTIPQGGAELDGVPRPSASVTPGSPAVRQRPDRRHRRGCDFSAVSACQRTIRSVPDTAASHRDLQQARTTHLSIGE